MPELALGVLLVAGGALAAVMWYLSVTTATTVVVAARDLPRGHVVEPADLRAAKVTGAEGVALLSGADAQVLLGRILTGDVSASTALTPSMVTDRLPLSASEALVSVALAVGHAPAELAPGDTVRIVVVAERQLGVASPPLIVDPLAEVWSVMASSEYDPTTLVTLRAPLEVAPVIAGADHVRLVLVEPGP